jgi:tetratricopeptide (TPR) repeat protein
MLFRFLKLCALGLIVVIAVPQVHAQSNGSTETVKGLVERAGAAKNSGAIDQALSLYEQAVQLAPRSPQVRWEYGHFLYDLDRYSDAAVQFRELTRFAPQAGVAVGMLGLCEFEMKAYDEADSHLAQALKLGVPDVGIERVIAYHSALVAIRSSTFDDASETLTRLITAGGVPAQMRTAMGLALLRMPILPADLDLQKKELVFSAGDAAVQLALKHFSEAEKTLSALIAQNPRIPFLHLALARTLSDEGRPEEASAQLKAEEELSGQNDATRTLAADIAAPSHKTVNVPATSASIGDSARFDSLSQKAMYAAQTGRTEEALASFKQALSLNPNWRDGLMSAGTLAYSAGDITQAAEYLSKLTAVDPTDGTAFAMLGLCEFQKKDFESAFHHLQRGHALGMRAAPEAVASADYHLAILYTSRDEFDRALDLLKQIATDPSIHEQAKFAMGLTLLRKPVLPDDVSPSDKPLVSQAGQAAGLLAISHYPEAFKILNQILTENPSRPGIHNAYGWALLSVSRYDEAEAQFRAEAAIAPQDPTALVGLASTALKSHRVPVAIEAAKHAVALAPRSGRAHEIYGRALLQSGDTNQAVAELEKAVDLAIDLPEAHFSLARAYAAANRPADAERERQQFQKLKR